MDGDDHRPDDAEMRLRALERDNERLKELVRALMDKVEKVSQDRFLLRNP